MSDALLTEIVDAGKAIGLLGPDGGLKPEWFQDPLTHLEQILKNSDQRAAFLDLLDQLVPPAPIAGIDPHEKWHPMVGKPGANLYLTASSNGAVKFGLAGDLSGGGPAKASLRAHLPILSFTNNSLNTIAGGPEGPLDLTLRVELNLVHSAASIGLKAIAVSIRLKPAVPSFDLQAVLEGLDLDGTGPKDTTLDSSNLGAEATHVAVGLIREALHEIKSPSPDVKLVIDHLMPLFGLGTDGIPPFPFLNLLNGPAALQGWFNTLISSGKMTTWLGHLGGLFGIGPGAIGNGTPADPWRVRIAALDGGSSELTFTTVSINQKLHIGIQASLIPAAGAKARFDASAVIAAIPLAGNGNAGVLPSASLVMRSLGGTLVSTPAIKADSFQAGIAWNGSALTPVLEMDNVDLTLGSTTHYDKIDLTNADGAIASAASDILNNVLLPKFGGAGQHLAALACLVKPAGDAGWTHLVDPAKLLSNPTGAIAAMHRAALQDSTHHWGFLLAEAAALLGFADPVTGTGTAGDPWRVPLASEGPLNLSLAAWNGQTVPGCDPLLRIGLQLGAASIPWSAFWLAELLSFDLPAAGGGAVSLMGGQHASFQLSPIPAGAPVAGMSFGAASVGITLDWTPGTSMKMAGAVTDISITELGTTTPIGTFFFPPQKPFDLNNPKPSIGLDITSLETVFRLMLTRAAYSWADMPGIATAILLGLHGNLPGLQSDWPVLTDPGGTGVIFTDPLGSLRDWLSRVAVNVSTDKTPFLPAALKWLAALLADELPTSLGTPPLAGAQLPGNGVYEDPWRLPLAGTGSRPVELLTWLEPQGPPATWAAPLHDAIGLTGSFSDLLSAAAPLAQLVPEIRNALSATNLAAMAGDLTALSSFFATSDGVVPLASQVPADPAWTTGTAVPGAHHLQPSNPAAITQIINKVNALPGPHAVLLLGPAFSDHNIWTPLLTQAGAVKAGTNFNLRVPNVDPANIDLSGVTAVNSYYTADLQDNGAGELPKLTAQIAKIAARLAVLQPAPKLILVAHSTAGIAARAYAASNPATIAGLITLGTPHLGAGLNPLVDPDIASAVRFIQRLALTLPAGPVQDIVAHLGAALDSYLPPPAPNQLPVANPYPFGSFAAPGTVETGGVPALALGGTLGADLLGVLRTTLANKAAAVAAGPVVAPTHLAFAVQGHLNVPAAAPGAIAVDASIRADAFRIALHAGAPEPARPKHSVTILATLTDSDGWLAGSATSFLELGAPLANVRVRWAEIGMSILPASVTPIVRLHDAAFQSPTLPLVDLNDAATKTLALPLLGSIFHEISPADLSPASPVGVLMDALTKLGIAVVDPHGGTGISADAFAAIQVDPAGYLVPQLLNAFTLPGGVLGISGPAGGPWVLPIASGPFEVYVFDTTSWGIGVRVPSPAQITFGGTAALSFDASVTIPGLVPTLDLSFSVAALTLTATSAGQVSLSAPPWLDPLALPPTAASLKTALEQAIPRILLSSGVTALFESVLGPMVRIGPIDKLLGAPGSTMKGSGAMGNGSGLDSGKINGLLEMIGSALGQPGPGLGLPAGLRLQAAGVEPVVVSLTATTPIGGVLTFDLDAKIDSQLHVTPEGTLTLAVPVPAPWNTVTVTFGISAAGPTLSFAAQGLAPIQLLPTFSGFGSLLGAAQTLLPTALDSLTAALSPSALKSNAITLAQALALHDGTSFANESANWKLLLQGNWWSLINNSQQNVAAALAGVVNSMGGTIPGTVSAQGKGLKWSFPSGSPWISATFGVDQTGPSISIAATNFQPAGSPLTLGFTAGVSSNLQPQAGLTFGISLANSLGIASVPQFAVAYSGTAFKADFYPLGQANGNLLDIQLLPTPKVIAQQAGLENFVTGWLLPVASQILFNATSTHLGETLWNNGPTLSNVLKSAGIVDGTNKLVLPLPAIKNMVVGALTGMVSGTTFTVDNLHFKVVSEIPTASGFSKPCLGMRLFGHQDIVASDSLAVSLRFGESASQPNWISDPTAGVSIYLFDTDLNFKPRLSVVGLGVEFSGGQGTPLINTSFLRTGQIAGYLFFDVNFQPFNFQNFGVGLEIDQFGIPLGQALGGDEAGSNPVASGLLKHDGGGGDKQPVNPSVDLFLTYRNNAFSIQIQNQKAALWIGIHQKFGPIYIDQIGLEIIDTPKKGVALLVDGSVQLGGLLVQADELGVDIPFNALASPKEWTLDLRGLAVSYNSDGVSIAGGLLKNTSGKYVEYDGMLKVEIAGKGFTAVGGYSQPGDGPGSYTSVFIFVSLPIVLGGPPYFFVTGLGGGAGINRRLLPPDDINQIPNFLLVAAIDDTTFSNDPMAALKNMALSIPARRGSYWFAAGIRFDSFVIVHSVAVVYVAIDGGFEIGILGVSRMALPTADLAIASVELALKIRFSTAEGLFSVQAQLTDNSYLFSRDCQLTGGFAFFVWFTKGQFLITIGGYHPAFQKPPEFPSVPRLGFHWSVSDVIVIKGEAYFALTNTCVMAGGRLEVTAHLGPARAWLIAYADFLISWDPFHYDIAIGVSIGVALDFDVCFIVCGHVHIEVSLGADLHIVGPPLHGEASVHILFFTITIPFGDSNTSDPPYITDFNTFSKKYLSSGDPANKVVGVRVTGGLQPPDPPGAKPNPGSKSQPWQLGAEFSFISETRMPASTYSWALTTLAAGSSGAVPEAAVLDLAAMDKTKVPSDHKLSIFIGDSGAKATTTADHWIVTKIVSPFPEATWRWADPQHMPAAARTLPAVSGLNLEGVAKLEGQSQLIPIGKMVDDPPGYTKPLPFATFKPDFTKYLMDAGTAALTMSAQVATASSAKMLDAAQQVLTGDNFFATMRQQAGVPARGLSPMATRSLKRHRSAPPVVAPITTGLTMTAVQLGAPPVIARPPESGPLILGRPRLRTVMQGRPVPTADVPHSIHTSVLKVASAANTARTYPPVPLTIAGARLHRVPAPKAVRPTEAAHAPRTLHHPETSLLPGIAHAAQFDLAAKQIMETGVLLPSGATHLWDLPAHITFSIAATGTAGLRVVALDHAGHVLSDIEMMPQANPVPLPANTNAVALQCLGIPAQGFVAPPPGPGAISLSASAPDGFPAAGWQAGGIHPQVGALSVLGRGAHARLGTPRGTKHRGRKTSHAMIDVSRAALGQVGVETFLPGAATVVMVLLDGSDETAAVNGDLAIAAHGATLVTPPIPVGGGHRRALLYDVVPAPLTVGVPVTPVTGGTPVVAGTPVATSTPPTAATVAGARTPVAAVAAGLPIATVLKPRTSFSVTASSAQGWEISGIVGLKGKAIDWANRMHGDVPPHVVPQGPLTPDGSVRVKFVQSATTQGD
jgi:hypothetical protein